MYTCGYDNMNSWEYMHAKKERMEILDKFYRVFLFFGGGNRLILSNERSIIEG